MTAPGLYDLRQTPISGSFPGIEVHATLLDNALSGDFIREPPVYLDFALIIGLAMLMALLATHMSRPLSCLLLGFVASLAVFGGGVLGFVCGYWLPLAGPQITVWVVTILSLAGNYAVEGRQKRFLKSAFRQYLSPVVVDQLLANPDQLRLGGESRTLTMFFSDLQGFTRFSERLAPEKLTAFLNDYLSEMVDIIQEEGGTVDKFVGDAIVAFWNAPVAIADHAERAVRAALRCQESLERIRSEQSAVVGDGLRMRVGLHTGPAVVGNMGSRSRFDYSMLGDAVNLASRLEGANQQFGTWTLVSAATRQQVSDSKIQFRELGRLVVVGRQQAVTVYEAMTDRNDQELQRRLDLFADGLAAYYAGDFERARQVFAKISAIDSPARAYLKRLGSMGLTAPAGWRGEWVLTGK
ncbi:MAG: hypothetical protein C0614_07520 [Desulfuromonas sp.]|nr:MAG: hypothetical protein C0614_07520 [Desulfuromonas sp.]